MIFRTPATRTPATRRSTLSRATASIFETLETRALFSASTADYLSDLTPTSISNGYGPIGINQSNGESAANDGRTIDLKRTRYAKGLGVHAPSDISYNLAGNYATFISDVGVDHESGAAGSVDFQVYGDDALLYDSGTLVGNGHYNHVNLDVSGVQTLRLVVTDAGDGSVDDHADWAGARVVKSSSTAPTVILASSTQQGGGASAIFSTGSFVDPNSTGPFSATVDYGDGSGSQSLSLRDDNTFDLLHSYINAPAGVHHVVVTVSDGTSTGSSMINVTSTNTAPSGITLRNMDSSNRAHALAGLPFNAVGSFDDDGIGEGGTYTYRVDYGDGSKPDTGTISSAYFVQHTYAKAGRYNLTTTITDGGGNVARGTNSVIVANPTYTNVGDMAATDGSSPFVKDLNAGTGKAMVINGVKYAHGIGTISDSELNFNLDGNAHWLVGNVGIDDAAGKLGSADFQIYTDGTLQYESGKVTGVDAFKKFQVNLTGVHQLRLVVTDTGDGQDFDYADWAGIRYA